MFAGTEKVPHSQGAHMGEFKRQSAELQTRNSTAKREWHLVKQNLGKGKKIWKI